MQLEAAEFINDNTSTLNENQCPVCYTDIGNESHYTLECNHMFHTECAIQWFRRGNSSCPLCRRVNPYVNVADLYCNSCPDIYKCHMSNKNWEHAKFTFMKMVIRNKTAPKDLLIRFNRYNMYYNKHKEHMALLSKWRKTKEYKVYIKARRTNIKLNNKIYSLRRKVNEHKMQICSYPLIPYRFNPNILPTTTKKSTVTTRRPVTRSQGTIS